MMMNVYLALAMTVSAALEGIKNKIDPGKATDRDLYQMTEDEFKKLGIRRLPKNLLQAIEALKKDKLADEVLGSVMKKSFLSYKNDEWERYHQAVTDWEVKEYLRLY
jgi:glutamine synthetase